MSAPAPAPTAPTTPPMRTLAPAAPVTSTAPVAHAAPAPAIDPNSLAASISASSDPVALLSHVVLSVAAREASAAEQGQVLSAIQAACAAMLKSVREALLTAVAETPGEYAGFTVVSRAGSRTLDYNRLETEYPDVYSEMVRIGAPSLSVKYTN